MRPVERILVATDFSPDAALALAAAGEAAAPVGAEVIVLHVDDDARAAPLSSAAIARRDHARRELERARSDLAGRNVAVRTLLRPGDPAREILRMALSQEAGMIVIASHGRAGSSALLLGSVADRVVRHARLPVLLVRHPDRFVSEPTSLRAGRRIAEDEDDDADPDRGEADFYIRTSGAAEPSADASPALRTRASEA